MKARQQDFDALQKGATTLSIMTLSVTTLSITTLIITTFSIMTLNIRGLFVTFSISDSQDT